MKRKQLGVTLPEIIIVIVVVIGGVGWIWNIIRILQTISDPLILLILFRCLGTIVFPLGMMLGYVPN